MVNELTTMDFTYEELQIIKQALIVALDHEDEVDDPDEINKLIDRIDNESNLDLYER